MIHEAVSLEEARVVRPELSPLSDARTSIHTVLLATDLTAASAIATDQAIDLVSSLGARLLIVNVIPAAGSRGRTSVPYASVLRVDQERANRESALLEIVECARSRGVEAAYLLWSGEPGDAIVAAADAESADLIVVGTRGLDDAGRFLLGSVSDHVVYHASCPVLVAH